MGYNLCCQIHDVMHTLQDEIERENAAAMAARLHAQRSLHRGSSSSSSHATSSRGLSQPQIELAARVGTTEDADSSLSSSDAPGPPLRRRGSHDAGPMASTSLRHSPPAASGSSSLASSSAAGVSAGQARILGLFAAQDQRLLDVIKFKEKAVLQAKLAEEHARVGLSPVATHFRDRFKHVAAFAQQHDHEMAVETGDSVEHHGIGGHFQKLHAELKMEETRRRQTLQAMARRSVSLSRQYLDSLVEDGDDSALQAVLTDTTTCPIEMPDEGFDVYGNPVDPEVLDRLRRERLFPSEHEMELVPPVDTKKALALYLSNKAAVVEMLDGFADLVTTHIQPHLKNAMEVRNRGSLVEFLDFTARAAEFVCASRIQVRVAQLLHVLSASDVGDFAPIAAPFDALLGEFDATLAFIRFYREKVSKKQRKKT
ncbi:hypothetical protein PINS_up005245 [Pythium insidiosum]|nr:hypothetical protein PINS_up005245 [Pythium insidiosum]